MKIHKFVIFLAISYQLSAVSPVLAHFVKSDSGIGAVLHVDPGDDPIAGEPGNIILEFKDTQNKFDLSKCDCRLVVSKQNVEVFSEVLKPVAETQKLSSVTAITFPEKNIYKLVITGSSSIGEFPGFELTYDVRVAREVATPSSHNSEVVVHEEPSIHPAAFALIAVFLIGALLAFRKRKIAVIILVLMLVAHSVPMKAIHASHNTSVDSGAFACCLPVAAVIPLLPTEFEAITTPEPEMITSDLRLSTDSYINLFTRPPPF